MKINVPLTEKAFTSLTTDLYYYKEELGEECVRDHNHLNAVLRVYAQNRCNLTIKAILHPYMLTIHLIMTMICS